MYRQLIFIFFTLTVWLNAGAQQRIISLNGSISEMLCALGLETRIVGTDVTSNYPTSLQKTAKVGHNRNISAEGVLALRPSLVLGLDDQVNPQLIGQLKAACVTVVTFHQELTPDGVKKLLRQVAEATGTTERTPAIIQVFDRQLDSLRITPLHKKVLFIYARGVGTMLAGGTGTAVAEVISLAGGENAVSDFTNYKPLTPESLAAVNPDVILLFGDGLASVGGTEGLLMVPGIMQTNAGRNRRFITMEGELLTGFTLRLPWAIRELHDKIQPDQPGTKQKI